MKHFLLSLLVLINVNLYAQLTNATLTLQPGSEGKDAVVSSRIPNTPVANGNNLEFIALAWTNNGVLDIYRGLIDFDMSEIPVGAQITNAVLYLYWDPVSTNPGHSTLSGTNASIVQRITSNWTEATVTWNTQPTITTTNQVFVPQSSSGTQNYEINITNLVKDYHNDPSGSFGFLVRLQTETVYRSIIFASGDHSNFNLHPKLVVDYTYDLSVKETEYSKMIKVFPNPSSEYLSINAPFNFTYELYNVIGEKVLEEQTIINTPNNHTINISEFAKGTYLLNLRLENGIEVKKNITIH